MLKMLSDLINEHGSSTILKERLQLIADRYDLLDEKNTQIQEHNEKLESDLKSAQEKINSLEEALKENSANSSTLTLQEDTSQILKLLFQHESLDPSVIAHQLSMEIGVIEYHLNELDEKELAVIGSISSGNPLTGSRGSIEWCITPEGRKHVVEVIGV